VNPSTTLAIGRSGAFRDAAHFVPNNPAAPSTTGYDENVKLPRWPFLEQLSSGDWMAASGPSVSQRSRDLAPRTRSADRVVKSICPYCAVGCGQDVYVRDGKIIDIEGDPDSPISRGCLCPKGSATFQLVTGSHREQRVLYRAPHATAWQAISLDRAMQMVAERVHRTREATWEDQDRQGNPLRRTLGIAHLGGATLDNEENYQIKKLFTALGIIQVENQARI
jgi:formate dehydrogenase major subunit